jgi:hypothetical protein
VSVLGLSWREAWWKEAEILMLRHQLAVALRERPRVHSRLAWPDRAWLALLAGTLPAGRLAELRLIVTPATILRWHRDIVRRRWPRLSRRGRSGRPPVRRGPTRQVTARFRPARPSPASTVGMSAGAGSSNRLDWRAHSPPTSKPRQWQRFTRSSRCGPLGP